LDDTKSRQDALLARPNRRPAGLRDWQYPGVDEATLDALSKEEVVVMPK
jgi:hypothetical protein